jgi:two-component system, LytTR family, response regulator
MTIRTLIVDDVSIASPRIRTLLREHPDFEIAGESSCLEVVPAVLNLKPDLIFADVDSLGLGGVHSLERLPPHHLPDLVFVSAHDQYAVKAFDVGALDYLVRPFSKERFSLTLDRVRQRRKPGQSGGKMSFLGWLRQSVVDDKRPDRIVIKTGRRILLLETSRIEWVEAYGDYVKVHVGKQTYLTRDRMQRIEAKLNASKFVRVHRSAIVNLDFVSEFRPAQGGDYRLVLRDGTQLRLSRSYRHRIQESDRFTPHVVASTVAPEVNECS